MKRVSGVLSSLMMVWAIGCSSESAPEPQPTALAVGGWQPGTTLRSPREPGPRGYLDRRGIIHAHSVYSHDACDDEARDEETGEYNEPCFQDLRDGMCRTVQDFVMLSDHDSYFAEEEYPDVLLYRPDQGDVLVERQAQPVANWLGCPDADPVLVMAGTETGTMPVGLEAHVADTVAERKAIYGEVSAEAIETFKAHGAVALVQHTEDWSVDELVELPLDGFEMYNLHANLIYGAGGAFALISDLNYPERLPHPDLVFLAIVNEDARYLERWGGALAQGVQRVTTMATDCHRNALPQLLPDGERIDGYRRTMSWFSNHLLVEPKADGSWGDDDLKAALRAGRLFGTFEVMGYPEGFDYHARVGQEVHEMGDQVSLAAGVELVATLPQVAELDPQLPEPAITLRLLRAEEDGWDLVTEEAADLSYVPTEIGAYRVEVRMVPRHLAPYLSAYDHLAEQDFVWVYSNPVYVIE